MRLITLITIANTGIRSPNQSRGEHLVKLINLFASFPAVCGGKMREGEGVLNSHPHTRIKRGAKRKRRDSEDLPGKSLGVHGADDWRLCLVWGVSCSFFSEAVFWLNLALLRLLWGRSVCVCSKGMLLFFLFLCDGRIRIDTDVKIKPFLRNGIRAF